MSYPCDRQTNEREIALSALKLLELLGAALSFWSLSFFEYFAQLAYSCTHLFSDSTLVTCYQQRRRPLEPVVDAWEVRGHMNSELHALHSTVVTREVRPVRRLLVICCWFLVLLDETFAVVLTNGNTVADRCSTVLLYDRDVRWSVSIR